MLENQLISSILGDLSQGQRTLTPADIQSFFNRSTDTIRGMLKEKELALKVATKRYEALKDVKLDPTKPAQTPVQRIIEDLYGRLELAMVEFENRKQSKYNYLIKRLKMAVLSRQDSEILRCLFDITQLKEIHRNIHITELQDLIYKYSVMAEDEGVVYLELYTMQEERDGLLRNIDQIKTDIVVLRGILEQ